MGAANDSPGIAGRAARCCVDQLLEAVLAGVSGYGRPPSNNRQANQPGRESLRSKGFRRSGAGCTAIPPRCDQAISPWPPWPTGRWSSPEGQIASGSCCLARGRRHDPACRDRFCRQPGCGRGIPGVDARMLAQRGVGHGLPDDVLKPGVVITGAYPFGLVHGARVQGTGAGVTPLPIGLLFAAHSGGHASGYAPPAALPPAWAGSPIRIATS